MFSSFRFIYAIFYEDSLHIVIFFVTGLLYILNLSIELHTMGPISNHPYEFVFP